MVSIQVPLQRYGCSTRLALGAVARLRRRALVVGVGVLAALAFAPSALAGTLDQSQPVLGEWAGFVGDQIHNAQTFTAGTNGLLDQVDVAVSRPAPITEPLVVEIRAVVAGVPSGAALASVTVAASTIPNVFIPTSFISVAFNPAASVTAGTQDAIVLSSPPCGVVNCYHDEPQLAAFCPCCADREFGPVLPCSDSSES
jgi:hypothetical protein